MKHLPLLLILSCCAHLLYAQRSCDDLAQMLARGDIEGAFSKADNVDESAGPDCLNLAGEVCLKRGRNDRARSFFEKALALSTQNTGTRASSLNNLGLVFWNTGNNFEAKEYLIQALDIRMALYGTEHEKTAASLNDLGLVLSNTEPDAALEYYEQALEIYEALPDAPLEKVAQTKLNIGVIYRQLELFGDAINNFNDALKIWQTLHEEGHPNEGFVYANLGQTSLVMKQPGEALAYFEKALKVYEKHYGHRHPEIAYVYYMKGNIHHSREEFDEALASYQQALIANSLDFNDSHPEVNPRNESFYNANTLLSALYAKAQAFMDKSIYKTLKFNDLKLSLETLYVCDSIIDHLRRLRTNESDKIALGNAAAKVYETGVLLCHKMAYEAIKKEPYYEQSFYFSEKSKSAVLLESISDASAKSYAGIPEQELERETRLKEDITYYEQELAKKPGELLEKEYRNKLFELKQDYNDFVVRLEKEYPRYFDLKYNVKIPTVAEVQRVLDEETALVSYFLTEATGRIFVFQITKGSFQVDNVAQPAHFMHYLNGLRNSIKYQVYDLYLLTATDLYKVLFPSSLPKQVKKLVIIPSDRLGTIPYGALLTGKVKSKSEDYTQLPYLASQYATTYQYAAALYYQASADPPAESRTDRVFLCAPVQFRGMPDLPGTGEEVARLTDIFSRRSLRPEIYLRTDAHKSLVKSDRMKQYRYIHFATHGFVDESNPQLSRLSFFNGHDAVAEGDLFSGEIYNLDLSAKLVTLSACSTGLGKISRGEGVMGLSRAFAYAGARNMLVSLWSVSDESTIQLMIDFYDSIERDRFDLALQKAQQNMMTHPEYSKPFYWAPFILIGE